MASHRDATTRMDKSRALYWKEEDNELSSEDDELIPMIVLSSCRSRVCMDVSNSSGS